MNNYDVIIIGGGFYGLRIAQFLNEELGQKKILIIEKETEVMTRASYNNQARVHGGYHYPRSVLTAIRSKVNLPIFSSEYEDAIEKKYNNYYAVAKNFSKISSLQFQRFYERIGAKLNQSEEGLKYYRHIKFTHIIIDEYLNVRKRFMSITGNNSIKEEHLRNFFNIIKKSKGTSHYHSY